MWMPRCAYNQIVARKSNGHRVGICKSHPDAAISCYACLFLRLGIFRAANIRMALKAAQDKITPLTNRYKTLGTTNISALSVVEELTSLSRELNKLDNESLNSSPLTGSSINSTLIARRQ